MLPLPTLLAGLAFAGPALPAPAAPRPQSTDVLDAGLLFAGDAQSLDVFGGAVSISGGRALVGARGDVTAGGLTGSAYVFERQPDGAWLQVAKLLAAGGGSVDQFGYSVALDGERALVGAPRAPQGTSAEQGAAYVFERQPGGAWLQTAAFTAGDPGGRNAFGTAVDLEGDRALVGALRGKTPAGVATGTAHVFERGPGGLWVEVAELAPSDGQALDVFGIAVALSGDRAAVGASQSYPPAQPDTGAAYVFEREPGGAWVEAARLAPSGGAPADQFGNSVGLEGDVLVVGRPYATTAAGPTTGAAHVFERQAGGSWVETALLVGSDSATSDFFGGRVALGGGRIAVGAPSADTPAGLDAGQVYLYERDEGGAWAEAAAVTSSAASAGDDFGLGVSLSPERLLVGAPYGGPLLLGAGQVDVFRLCDGCLATVGTGTPGCAGPHALDVEVAPEVGATAFALTCTAAPANSIGVLGLADEADHGGSDALGLGVLLHLDPASSSFLSLLALPSDAAGVGRKPLAIPADPSLAGLGVVAQAAWAWGACAPSPSGLSTSPGLAFTLLAP